MLKWRRGSRTVRPVFLKSVSRCVAALIIVFVLTGCDMVHPLPTPAGAEAIYQAYERGFMAAWVSADCIYLYRTDIEWIYIPQEIASQPMGIYQYCVPYSFWEILPTEVPQDILRRIWEADSAVQSALGPPVGNSMRYWAGFLTPEPIIMGGIFYAGKVRLPDGRTLYCGQRAATSGRCELRPK